MTSASADPIYVDLDGTLIASDMLWESICQLLRHHPLYALRLPLWLLGGKAQFKDKISRRVMAGKAASDPATLPYRTDVIEYLEKERRRGREIVLATASHETVARSIAGHLGLFNDVLASDGENNLAGESKREEIEAHAHGRPYEYLGNSIRDVPIWRGANRAVLVAPSASAAREAARLEVPTHEIPTASGGWRPAVRALRLHQWSKNALLFVALLLAHQLMDLKQFAAVGIAFLCFSTIASGTYLLNDLLDIEADRQHPSKRNRPFAAGTLSIPTGFAMMAGLLCLGFGVSLALLPLKVTGMLALYAVGTTAYSFDLKQRLFVDALALAGLYTLRVLTGAVAADVPVSPWLLAFSTFFFLSLALVKRYAELLRVRSTQRESLVGRGYRVEDVSLVETLGVTAGYISVLILCLYVSNDAVSRLYPNPNVLWLISPIMLYWITRMWFLAKRGQLTDDPVLFAIRDKASYAAALMMLAVGMLAAL